MKAAIAKTDDRAEQFIRENTRVLHPPLVPEIKLHLAEESLPIWRRTEEELGAMNVPMPFWAFAWAGGQALARYILDNPGDVSGRSVIDLGTGSGIVAIAAMVAGAKRVTAVDIDPFALCACRINAKLNEVDLAPADTNPLNDDRAHCDVLCLSDVFYEDRLSDAMMRAAESAWQKGTDVLVGDPGRSYFPAQKFDRQAAYEVPVTRELEDSEIKRAAVWRLKSDAPKPM